mmetsp:Transcript_68520/g.172656  ORF Transcript_68520/g.172656 Transcript_68520/m.172656 type:complete len:219 (-) Transcript_68520:1329-1985(-)
MKRRRRCASFEDIPFSQGKTSASIVAMIRVAHESKPEAAKSRSRSRYPLVRFAISSVSMLFNVNSCGTTPLRCSGCVLWCSKVSKIDLKFSACVEKASTSSSSVACSCKRWKFEIKVLTSVPFTSFSNFSCANCSACCTLVSWKAFTFDASLGSVARKPPKSFSKATMALWWCRSASSRGVLRKRSRGLGSTRASSSMYVAVVRFPSLAARCRQDRES